MPSKYRPYYPRVANRSQQSDDVERGLSIGKQIGGLLSPLAGAIKEARMNAVANQLMDEQSIGDQPGAGVTRSIGKLGDDGSTDAPSGSPQDLGPMPADTSTFTNPATGNVEPLQGQGSSDDDFARAIAASQLQGAPAAPMVGGQQPGGPQPSDDDLRRAMSAKQLQSGGPISAGGSDFTLNPSDYSAGGTAFGAPQTGAGTVGSLIHTGGVEEMKLRQAAAAQRFQQQKEQASLADEQAKAAGTGRYAIDAATKRAQLENIQSEIAARKAKPEKTDKNPPAENIGSEPVIDQNQLVNHFEGTYGKGSFADVMSNLDQVDTKTSPGFVIVGPPDKPVAKIPMGDAQVMVKQQNALRLKQGLSAFRVPGEDQTVGATPGNPYIAHNNLDVYSRAPGTWIRLPNGKVAQVPGRR